MSMELMVRVMKAKIGDPLSKLVLLKMADNASDDGRCWPSYQHIADQCEMDRRTAMRHVDKLCACGFLQKELRKGVKGNTSNAYRLTPDNGSAEMLKNLKSAKKLRQMGSVTETPPPSVSESPGLVSQDHPGSVTETPTPGVTESPRTSHSFEPVIEPEKNSCPDASLSDAKISKADFLNRHPEAVVCSPAKRQWGSQEDLTCAQWIWKRVLKLYEEAATYDGELVRPKEPNWTAWSNDVRLMRTLDGRTHRQICEMFERVQKDTFWIKQVRCPAKLREKWDDLAIRLSGSAATGARDVNKISRPDSEIPPGFRG
ncbi:helix-turn-helix domain-containing protein [Enterobacter asburiae]|uniref:helix-turn-helix domain-containing protein n=1 Tax=Enterobacter asburiae TaxID=61645 RepID=UPI001575B183|nr:helix-turn-helix domain-containing protein [Enterobacter asburiae]NQF31007.1 helix-turn-helix domain-containing protein [Enterobacter asburiae]